MPDAEIIKAKITLIVYLGLEKLRFNVEENTPIKTKPVSIAINDAGRSNIKGTNAQANTAKIIMTTLEITEEM